MPIPRETPKELHPALKRLSELTDLVGLQDYIGRKTKDGDKPGPEPWYWTRKYTSEHALCTPDEAIKLLEEVGAENDTEAMFHVVVSLKWIP